MLKNREILTGYGFIIILILISAWICRNEPSYGAVVILTDGVFLVVGFYFFCSYRYRKIRELSEFLRRAQYEMLPLEAYD